MKHIPTIAAGLLGLMFLTFGLNFFLHFLPMPPGPPEGSPPALFMAALYPTGYLAFVKLFEIAGGVLVAVPKLRRIGLLLLGPVVVNILCFHTFLTGGSTLADPVLIAVVVLSAYLVWVERAAFKALVK